MDSRQRQRLNLWWKKWSPLIVVVAAGGWTVITALVAGSWSVYQFKENTQQFYTKLERDRVEAETIRRSQVQEAEKARIAAAAEAERNRAATEKENSASRRIEAQKPFLEKRLAAYLEAVRVSSRLTELDLQTDSEVWKENARKFFQLRWGELEMVGDLGIRNAARLVGEEINHVIDFPLEDRHNLRWSVECLADELRYSLEHTWGLQKDLRRETVYIDFVPKLPSGCTEGRDPALAPPGMRIGMERGPQSRSNSQ
ncbi:hypothetical protein ACKWRH_28235 [Bradyrhizobium sp. Pa8]|uniref:hypothetical protein n=1 Tax=Bradyrhizobium sp. Pa8 TaxID=3386552 RepID=UPI00403F501F